MSLDLIRHRAATVGAGTDMAEHMTTLQAYAAQCPRVIEFGVYDCTSTWALLAGAPKWMRSYDVARRAEVDEVERAAAAAGIDFKFVLQNTLDATPEPADLLFIDSFHTYGQMQAELVRHGPHVSQFIIAHDTTIFGDVDQCGKQPGLWPAIAEWLAAHPEWKLRVRYTNCNGLTVLQRS